MSSRLEEHTIATTVHGHYYLEGPSLGPLLIGFHGYGENARNHLKELRRISGIETWLRCGVHALSHFYNSKTGDVLGSWMTKLGREQAITDNIAYVSAVARQLGAADSPGRPLVFAGFSQGVAMAYRAAAFSGIPCHGLVVLAGDVPPDLLASDSLSLPPILLGRGTRDSWYTEQKMEKDLRDLAERGAEVSTCVFEGGHEWGEDFLAASGDFLAARLA